jgi:hypothetical protein
MGWVVRRNDLGAIARAIPQEVDGAVVDMANDLADLYRITGWKRTGTLTGRAISIDHARDLHAEVKVGYYLGVGFYSGFQEFGTRRQAARPIVADGARAAEPIYASYVEKAVKHACEAR